MEEYNMSIAAWFPGTEEEYEKIRQSQEPVSDPPIDNSNPTFPPTKPGWYDLTLRIEVKMEDDREPEVYIYDKDDNLLDVNWLSCIKGQWASIKEPDESSPLINQK